MRKVECSEAVVLRSFMEGHLLQRWGPVARLTDDYHFHPTGSLEVNYEATEMPKHLHGQ